MRLDESFVNDGVYYSGSKFKSAEWLDGINGSGFATVERRLRVYDFFYLLYVSLAVPESVAFDDLFLPSWFSDEN